jgi:glycosyltransferase involved in cell wall biosynthesis
MSQQTANFPSMGAYVVNAIRVGRMLLRQQRYDNINTHFALPTGPVGQALCRMARIPNVLSVHGGDLYDPSKLSSPHRHALLRASVRYLLHHADAVVAQSQNTAANVERCFSNRIAPQLIPLGIPRRNIPPANRAGFGLSDDCFVIVSIGRLVKRKANDRLIEVLAKLQDDSIRLIIIGDGPERIALEDRVRSNNLCGWVHFAGHVSDEEKYELLSLADIYASTSQHEGFGLVYLERLATGLPIICYDNGGQTDFLVDGKTGFVVALNDEDTFAKRINTLRNDRKLKDRQSASCLRIADNYMIDRCAKKYEALFH